MQIRGNRPNKTRYKLLKFMNYLAACNVIGAVKVREPCAGFPPEPPNCARLNPRRPLAAPTLGRTARLSETPRPRRTQARDGAVSP